MEPRNDESQKSQEPAKERKEKKRRFQIVKLEERIAPGQGGNHTEGGGCIAHTYGNCYSRHRSRIC